MKKVLINLFLTTLMLLSTQEMLEANNIKNFKLENGLTVVLLEDPTASIVSVKTIVKIGSVYEKNYYGSGISHYLEHIVAGGSTTTHSEDFYTKRLSIMGGISNAYTTTDHTSYFINTTKEHTNEAIDIMYEWMFLNSFEEKEVIREKEVITREIEKNNSNVNRKFYYLTQENLYKTHPVRLPVIGYLDQFLKTTRDDLINFYNTYYTPSNMILIIGGNINISDVKKQINETFNKQKKVAPAIFYDAVETPPSVKRTKKHYLDMKKTIVNLKFPTVKLNSEYLYSLDLLDYLLGNGTQSFLYKKLVDEKKIAFSVYTSSYTPQYCSGYFEIQIETDEKNIEKVKQETFKILETLKKKYISKKLLDKAKKQKLAENILSIDSIEDKITRAGLSVFYSDTTDFYDQYAQNFKQVTVNDIQVAANKFFNFSKLVTTIGLEKKVLEKNNKLTVNSKKLEEIEKITLKNGVRLLLYQDESMPAARAQILSLGGILNETEKDNGIGTLFSNLVGNKTTTLSKEKIQSLFEDNGAYTSAAIGNHTFYYTLNSLSEDFDELFNLYLSTFFNIDFKQQDIIEEKKKISNKIKQREDDWYSSNSYIFKKEFWKNHPYSMSKLGERESIDKLTKKNLFDYHKSLLNPEQIIISIQGQFNKETIINTIEHYTNKLEIPSEKKTIDFTVESQTELKEFEKEHKFQTTSIFLGYNGTNLNNVKDKVELDLVDAILSGMSYPGGRLHNKLRGKGYVYLVHGINFAGLHDGYLYI